MSLRRSVLMPVLLLAGAAVLALASGCGGAATPSATADITISSTGDEAPSPTSGNRNGGEVKRKTDQANLDKPAEPSTTPPGSASTPTRREPEITPTSTEVGRSTFKIEYGQVPEGFVPEIPDLETIGERMLFITMEQSIIGALKEVTVVTLMPGRYYSPSNYQESAWSIVEEDYQALRGERALVLECGYKHPSYGSTYEFWFESTPSLADPDRLRNRLPEHPLLKRVLGALSQCPASTTELRSKLIELGASPQNAIAAVFVPLGGNWDQPSKWRPVYYTDGSSSGYIQSGYYHLKFLRISDDGERDVYKLFDYNSSGRRPQLVSEGTLTVDADGNGYMEFPGCMGCLYWYGGEVTFSTPYRARATLNVFSPSGEKTGEVVAINLKRRQ